MLVLVLIHSHSIQCVFEFFVVGLKYVISGSYRNVKCSQERYQPITFWSTRNTDCLYSKSTCSYTGQIVSDKMSTIADSSCRCDYRRNYAFVSQPRNPCYCTPSIEDCSCYIKHCPYNTSLSTGKSVCAFNRFLYVFIVCNLSTI